MGTLRRASGAVVGLAVGALLWTEVAVWAFWLLPLVVVVIGAAARRRTTFFHFIVVASLGTIFNGVWAAAIVAHPEYLPHVVQTLLTWPAGQHTVTNAAGRFGAEGVQVPEVLGLIYFMSAGGGAFLLLLAWMILVSRMSTSRTARVVLLKMAALVVCVCPTLVLRHYGNDWWVLYGFASWLLSIGFLWNDDDPAEELMRWRTE